MESPLSLAIASATLARGTRFLGAGLQGNGQDIASRPIIGIHRAKVIGNGLRELDRFLNLLIDEVAIAVALPAQDRAQLARQRNTANKLRVVRDALMLPNPDHARLRAIGRSRDCLFHCAGIVRRADERGGIGMTCGWNAGAVYQFGERLVMDPADLADICRFYDRVAAELVAAGAARC